MGSGSECLFSWMSPSVMTDEWGTSQTNLFWQVHQIGDLGGLLPGWSPRHSDDWGPLAVGSGILGALTKLYRLFSQPPIQSVRTIIISRLGWLWYLSGVGAYNLKLSQLFWRCKYTVIFCFELTLKFSELN